MSCCLSRVIVVAVVIGLFGSGCAPALLHVAVGGERGRAGLTKHHERIGDSELVLLRREGGGSSAPTVVFVHGFGADKDNWTRMAAFLPTSWNLIMPDLAGFGESERDPNARHDVVAQAARLHTLVQTAPSRPVVVVGNSMGGHIAAAFAALYPQDVSSLILIDPAGVKPPRESEVHLAMQRGEKPLLASSVEDFDRILGLMFVHPPELPGVIKAYFAERAAKNRDFNDYVFSQMAATPFPLEPQLSSIRAKTLILWGKDDRVLDVSGGDVFVAGIPDARLVIMEGTGHTPMIERPKDVAAVVGAFVGIF